MIKTMRELWAESENRGRPRLGHCRGRPRLGHCRTTLSLRPETLAHLRELAALRGMSMSAIIDEVIAGCYHPERDAAIEQSR
jgi:hypothetical protein